MASIFAHAAVPLVVRRAFDFPEGLTRRLDVVAVLCAIWPDVDYATLAFEVRPTDVLGHRGATHSLFVAALVAVCAGAMAFRSLRIGSRAWWRVVAFLFFAGASHGLLDALTAGDVGVALFWPLDHGRHAFPFKLIASCPVGMNEYFGFWGVLTIANELLYVVIPLALVVAFVRARDRRRRTGLAVIAWAMCMIALRVAMPEDFVPVAPRVLEPMGSVDQGNPNDIPRADLPDGKLVTKLDDMRALFDVALVPSTSTWSSSFFPTWFGGYAGRWTEGAPRLAWRTMFGFSAPTEPEARAWIANAAAGDAAAQKRLFTLSPTEKIDLAYGRFDFPVTSQALAVTHNRSPKPRYWSGRCNGIAAASISEAEPFRVVDVVGVDGTRVRFHPNDVKSLLAVAYDDSQTMTIVGGVCTTLAFDAGATCSMNPGVLLLVIVNRIGIAKQSFLVDALPTVAKQYYAVASARIHAGTPHALGKTRVAPGFAAKIASVVDVDMELTLSSTTLAMGRADVIDPASHDGSRYTRVGVVPVVMKYSAVVALDAEGNVAGGMWTGDPADGPDDVLLASGGPKLENGDMLASADRIPWSFVRELARASTQDGEAVPTIDLRTHCDGRCP